METPDNIDGLLADLKVNPPTRRLFTDRDEQLIRGMVRDSKNPGTVGVFIVEHPDGRLEYLITNVSRERAVITASRFISRQAELLEDRPQ